MDVGDDGWVTDPEALKVLLLMRALEPDDLVKYRSTVGEGEIPVRVGEYAYVIYERWLPLQVDTWRIVGWKRPTKGG